MNFLKIKNSYSYSAKEILISNFTSEIYWKNTIFFWKNPILLIVTNSQNSYNTIVLNKIHV